MKRAGIARRLEIGLVSLTLLAVALALAGQAGAFERSVFTPTSYSPFGSFAHPTGVAIDTSTGEVLIADGSPSNVVDAFGLEGGSLLGSLSGTGSETFEFSTVPVGVAVDNDSTSASFQDLYVTDFTHNVVDKFKRTGSGAYEYICQINGWYGVGTEACHVSGGAPAEPFFLPIGAAVDAQGNVYIANYGPEKGVVDEFDAAGNGVLQVKASEHALISGHPQGVAVDTNGNLFVRNLEREGLVAELKRNSLTGAVVSEQQIANASTAIAIDSSINNIYVDSGSQAAVYQSTGSGELELKSEFGAGILGNSLGIAVNGATHITYATDAANGNATAFVSRPVVVPDLTGSCTATAATTTSATLHGEVDPLGTEGAQYTFEYGLTTAYENQTGGPLEGTGFRPVSAEISGLAPGETYHCRLNVTDTEGLAGGLTNEGPDGTFETLPLLPVVDEIPATATEITTDSAILNGQVNPGNGPTRYHFAYGLHANNYPNVLPDVGIGTGLTPITVEQAPPPASLKQNTTYHFVLVASNASGTVTGPDETFRTTSNGTPPETPPVVGTGPAEAIAQNTATLTGTAYPEGTATLCCFALGIDATYGTLIFTGEAGRERGAVTVTQPVANLQPNTTYHYRLECFNAAGKTIGPDRAFTTTTFLQEIVQPLTPGLVPIPVFPKVKNPIIKRPKKHHKKHHKPKRRKAHEGRAKARVRQR